MGNIRSHLSQRRTIDITTDSNEAVRYGPPSSLLTTKARCSQAGCMKYQDGGNYLGFCIDCYKNYRCILFEDSGPPALTVSGGAHHGSGASSSSSRTIQASQRSSHSGILVTTNVSRYPLSYSYSSRTNESGTARTRIISQLRTTGTSSARTPGTTFTSARTPGTTSTRTTSNTTLWTTHEPRGDCTVAHGTGGWRSPRLPLISTTGISQMRTTGTSSARPPGTTFTSTRTPGTTSAKTTGNTTLWTTHEPLGDGTVAHGTGGWRSPRLPLISTTGISQMRTTGTSSARTPGTTSTSTRTHGTTSTKTTGNTYLQTTHDPLYYATGLTSTTTGTTSASARASGTSITRTEGVAHGSTSGLNVGSGVGTGNSISTNTHVSTGAQPKQYQSFPSVEDLEIIPAVPNIPEIRPRDYSPSTSSQGNVAAKPSKPDEQSGASTLSTEPDSRVVIVKTMRETLLCPICFELLEDAKTLPCQHTVCKDCLAQWVATKKELKCPTCNTRQKSPTSGVDGLPSNFTLNNLVAEMKKMDKAQMEAEARALRIQESDDSVKSQSISTMISGASPIDGLNLHSHTDHKFQQDVPVANMSFFQNVDESFNLAGSAVRMKIQLCNAEGHPLPATNSDTVEDLEVTLCDPTGAEVHLNIDKCDGDFCVTFVAHEVGTHIVHALLGGEAIIGSPAVIEIYTR